MPLVIGPFDGLGLKGVPWLDVGLVGVTSMGNPLLVGNKYP